MEIDEKKGLKQKKKKKITQERLKNIALYYLQRFDSSKENLRNVLMKRVFEYAFENPDFDKFAAQNWIDQIISDFSRLGYLNDYRFAEFKIATYLSAGKPERYIRQKLKQKGIDDNIIDRILSESEIDEKKAALKFAQKKKIGPFREDEEAMKKSWQKDMGTMIRAGFDYETAKDVLGSKNFDENI